MNQVKRKWRPHPTQSSEGWSTLGCKTCPSELQHFGGCWIQGESRVPEPESVVSASTISDERCAGVVIGNYDLGVYHVEKHS